MNFNGCEDNEKVTNEKSEACVGSMKPKYRKPNMCIKTTTLSTVLNEWSKSLWPRRIVSLPSNAIDFLCDGNWFDCFGVLFPLPTTNVQHAVCCDMHDKASEDYCSLDERILVVLAK